MVTKTQAIKRFLTGLTHPDLAALYSHDMEVQVNVAQGKGVKVSGEYKGVKWHGWTDDVTTWKPFRIPWNASSNPSYDDSEIKFDLAEHAEGIGMTGWDWKNRVSRWVAFDYDAIAGHSDLHTSKLSPAELDTVRDAACTIPWVTVRRSTSGSGIHLYVFLKPVPTENHHEHAALGRSILGTMAALTGHDFSAKVDVCGGNMWVWHRKMKGTNGLTLIKQGTILESVPANWQDHVAVVKGKKKRSVPKFVGATEELPKSDTKDDGDLFDELCGRYLRVPLDDKHKQLLTWLEANGALWWWDADRHLLVCHTSDLKRSASELSIKGIFETTATGQEHGQDQNCFCFPMLQGAWAVRRHTKGVQEHPSWEQDTSGWTRAYFNREPSLSAACRAFGGIEDTDGSYVFKEAEMAATAARALNVTIEVPPQYARGRQTRLKLSKEKRLVCEFQHQDGDDSKNLDGWLVKKSKWIKVFRQQVDQYAEPEVPSYDATLRHITSETGEDCGWSMHDEGKWFAEPLAHIKLALRSHGLLGPDIEVIMGAQVSKRWTLINRPFEPEYVGNRQWNRGAAQLRFAPSDSEIKSYPTWTKVLSHTGKGLDSAVLSNSWCKANNILTGGDYLKLWAASLFQKPHEPLPYLFLYGPQNSGKSILHEALALLVTAGYQRADLALTSQANFNGELENAVICVVEETDLRKTPQAVNKIKDWVTSRHLNIRHLFRSPYHVLNTTHWIQCSNDAQACPVLPGDTRITMIFVNSLDPTQLIPKRQLIPLLEKEAPDFIADILKMEIPESNDRLLVPVIQTDEKTATQVANMTTIQMFCHECCFEISGSAILFATLYDRFLEWCDPQEAGLWSKIRFGRELPPQFPRGMFGSGGQQHVGNISISKDTQPTMRLVLRGRMLTHEH